MKYNLNHKHKNWIQNLGIEAECAISLLPQEDQEYMRLCVAKQIDKIYYQRPSNHHVTPIKSRELRISKSITEQLIMNNATITKTDKGNSIVIMYNTDYDDKVSNFIHNNKAHVTTNNTKATFQKELKLTLNGCKTIISPEISWKLTNLNPKTSNLKGLLKVHKTNMPIRPVVDYSPAPVYKTAKKLSNILKTYVPLTYAFNIRNSAHLIKDHSTGLSRKSSLLLLQVPNVKPPQKRLKKAKAMKEKLIVNSATITKTDKGNSIVIMYNTDYDDKVSNFTHNNNANVTTNNTTATFQKELNLTLKGCKMIISPEISWKLTNLNPKTPQPERPVKGTQNQHAHPPSS